MPSDPWLMLSSAGFVVSLTLWFALLKKFHQAGQVAEAALAEEGPSLDHIEPVPVKQKDLAESSTLTPIKGAADTSEATLMVVPPPAVLEATLKMPPAPQPEPIPAIAVAVAPAPTSIPAAAATVVPVQVPPASAEPTPAKPVLPGVGAPVPNLKSGQTLTGGISPAVVYLQNLKEQLEGLRKEVQSVKMQVSDVSQKSESQLSQILRRLDQIAAAQAAGGATAPQPQAAMPAAPPDPEPQSSSAPAFNLEMPPEKDESQAAPQPEPAPSEPRKGPVWPT